MKFIFKRAIIYITETDDTRRKRVSSLKAWKLRSQLATGELGASRTTFSKCIDSSYGSVVPSWAQFRNVSLKFRISSSQGPIC